jgi:hypothetical protein
MLHHFITGSRIERCRGYRPSLPPHQRWQGGDRGVSGEAGMGCRRAWWCWVTARDAGGNTRPAIWVVTAGVAPATLGFTGSWAREGEHENQIEEKGEVEHGEADQNPTSPALERTGLAGARQSRPVAAEATHGSRARRGERGRVSVSLIDRVDRPGLTRPAGSPMVGLARLGPLGPPS